MGIKKMKKEEIELLSNKEITFLLLSESKRAITTADLFKKIMKLKDMPESYFESKIGDYYIALSTDKKFVMLDNGKWDLRSRHTSDLIPKVTDEDDEEDIEEPIEKEELEDEEDDNYDDNASDDDYDAANEDLKDLVVIDEDDLDSEE